jgi:putative homogalacturonan methyltransferase
LWPVELKHFSLPPCRCHLVDVLVEMDRILRPEGTAIIRDRPDVIKKLTSIAHAIRWTTEVYESEPESNNGENCVRVDRRCS